MKYMLKMSLFVTIADKKKLDKRIFLFHLTLTNRI